MSYESGMTLTEILIALFLVTTASLFMIQQVWSISQSVKKQKIMIIQAQNILNDRERMVL